MLSNRRIILGISGGIAAYKSVDLARQLVKAGAQVQVVLTEGAMNFVSPTALQAVTSRSVRSQLWDDQAEAAMSHIELARWADCVLVAPATAHLLARMAQGLADDLLTTLLLATSAPVLVAPAMNGHMWRHAATQENVAKLQAHGVQLLPPEQGWLACGDIDVGRLAANEQIVAWLTASFQPKCWSNQRLLITAGPTIEDIDPVRFIANRSSGKMGYALAAAAVAMGAEVCLVSGPTQLTPPAGVHVISVRSAEQMFAQVQQLFADYDVLIAAAAVADYRVAQVATQKIKKQGDAEITLSLLPNPDIVAWAGQNKGKAKVVAFAAETENMIANARLKRERKNADVIIANSVAQGAGFDQDEHQLTLISADELYEFARMPKTQLAQQLLIKLADVLMITPAPY